MYITVKTAKRETCNNIMKETLILIGLLLVSRLIGLDPNWTPMLATAIILPYLTDNKIFQYLLPASVMLVTDLYMASMLFPVVYGCMMFSTFLATKLDKYVATASGVLVWHVLVNGAVVLSGPGYAPFTPEAMLFDVKLLISSLLYVGLFDVVYRLFKRELRLA